MNGLLEISLLICREKYPCLNEKSLQKHILAKYTIKYL